ncbi:MAG: hypothetical protein ABSD74_20175 [Rhizomicrobium sp.]|jgi:hypothetical protein
MTIDRRWRKWLIMGLVGSASGAVTLFVFRSIPMASGTAMLAVIALVAAKHVALAIAVGSPLAALLQSIRPAIERYCPFAPGSGG